MSAGTLDRALQVMSQVLAVLESQGFSVEVSEQGGLPPSSMVGGSLLALRRRFGES